MITIGVDDPIISSYVFSDTLKEIASEMFGLVHSYFQNFRSEDSKLNEKIAKLLAQHSLEECQLQA